MPWKKAVPFFVLAGMCLWVVLLYSNIMRATFVFDDELFITKNPQLQNLGIESFANHLTPQKRIVGLLSFAINRHFNHFDARGYHAVNLGIHLLAGLLVVWLVGLIFKTPRMEGENIARHQQAIAFFVGGLFLSHPIQTESVTYIAQRFESLAALFYLAAVCLYLKGRISFHHRIRSGLSFLAAGVSAMLGLSTKETVFTLPAILWVLEIIFFRSLLQKNVSVRKPVFHWALLGALLSMLLFGGVFAFYLRSVNLYHIAFEPHLNKISAAQYLMTQFEVVPQYIGLLFLPLHQNVDYDFPAARFFFEPAVWAGFVWLSCILFAGIKSIRKYPLVGFGILWFLITLAVSSSIFPLRDVMVEHRLYLPAVGFSLAVCAGLYYFVKRERVIVGLL